MVHALVYFRHDLVTLTSEFDLMSRATRAIEYLSPTLEVTKTFHYRVTSPCRTHRQTDCNSQRGILLTGWLAVGV